MSAAWYDTLLANEERLLRLRQRTKALEDERLRLEAELDELTRRAEFLERELSQRGDA